jgi:hypothetical protein
MMKKARTVVLEDKVLRGRKTATKQSDQRLRQLYDQAQCTSDARKKAKLKQEFLRHFYQGAD